MSSELRVDKIIPTGGVPADGGGGIIQVVHEKRTTSFTTTSQTYVDFMTATITPRFSTSKILISFGLYGGTNGDVNHPYASIFRDSTEIGSATDTGSRTGASAVFNTANMQQLHGGNQHLDSPATTSAITYRIKVRTSNAQTAYFGRSARDNNAVAYDGRSSSFLTLMEVSA